ncbi:MarR family winged helix-turn-helix transcriptional regulator [Arcobacter sp. F2176]|uniref:MarR family winged helix-turn-helix transcriptional regulator n=1 Tax=unclassified Arcobacter TaxID=2593671 RepID=UPI00100BCDF8|nr:MarR family transcriptional regulator [Arcobacter sp. F2176]RXJ79966.1 MarR family transcriptional regulator [Arcobacter sp. F2176]
MNINDLNADITAHKKIVLSPLSEVLKLTFPFYLAYNKIQKNISKIEDSNYNLSDSETDALITILALRDEKQTISPKKLSEKLIFSSAAITKVLKKLEDRKFIIRLDNEYDKRSKLVQITPLGEEICRKVFEDILTYENNCFSILSDKEKELFLTLFIKILKNI